MPLKKFVINDLTPSSTKTLIGDLRNVFKGLAYTHVPVTKEGVYLGCLSETDVFCFEPTYRVNNVMYAIEGFYVRNSTIWLTVLEKFAENDTNIMPVLDPDNKYLGYYQLNDIISMFNHTPFFSEPGGVILVEKNNIDFSFSELSQIIESNNAKMLGAFISKTDGELTQITIKIGESSLTPFFQDFRRYGYTVVSSHEDDGFLQTLIERSDYLNNYLNQ
jgi:hypothetical protein